MEAELEVLGGEGVRRRKSLLQPTEGPRVLQPLRGGGDFHFISFSYRVFFNVYLLRETFFVKYYTAHDKKN